MIHLAYVARLYIDYMNFFFRPYTILFSYYGYSIEWVKGKDNTLCDAFSRLPTPVDKPSKLEIDSHTEVHQIRDIAIDSLPVTPCLLRSRLFADPILSKVMTFVQTKWPGKRQLLPDFHPYFEKRGELSVEDNLLLLHNRIIIPSSLREQIQSTLHMGHPGMVATKSLAKFTVWFPNIDNAIEQFIKRCQSCQENRPAVIKTPLNNWNQPDFAMERLHIDFTGPYEGLYWFVITDAFSRWPEIIPMKSATSENVIVQIRKLIANYGLCYTIVSDNGSVFTSKEFADFCSANSVKLIHSSPYHSRTNGLVGRTIRSFKEHMRANSSISDINQRLATVPFTMRATVNATTGKTPSELFIGRRMLTPLDRLKPDLRHTVDFKKSRQAVYHDQHSRVHLFSINDAVWVKDVNAQRGWLPGTVLRRSGPLSYVIEVNGKSQRRHADHLRLRITPETPFDNEDDDDTALHVQPGLLNPLLSTSSTSSTVAQPSIQPSIMPQPTITAIANSPQPVPVSVTTPMTSSTTAPAAVKPKSRVIAPVQQPSRHSTRVTVRPNYYSETHF